jgi:hypothetical protein
MLEDGPEFEKDTLDMVNGRYGLFLPKICPLYMIHVSSKYVGFVRIASAVFCVLRWKRRYMTTSITYVADEGRGLILHLAAILFVCPISSQHYE